MRLGLLGPAEGDVDGLARAAELLVEVHRVDRALYLGPDRAADEAIARWARKLVGDDPSDDAAWRRAASIAVDGEPGEIDSFIRTERARLRLRAIEALPAGASRTVEMIGDRVAVLIYDKGQLDEEDIFAASLLVYGKSHEPLVKKVGARWFVSPGRIGCPGGGAAILDDTGDEVMASVYASDGTRTIFESLALTAAAKMKIQGGDAP